MKTEGGRTERMRDMQTKEVDVDRAYDRAHHVLGNPHAYRDHMQKLLATDVVGLVHRIRELEERREATHED